MQQHKSLHRHYYHHYHHHHHHHRDQHPHRHREFMHQHTRYHREGHRSPTAEPDWGVGGKFSYYSASELAEQHRHACPAHRHPRSRAGSAGPVAGGYVGDGAGGSSAGGTPAGGGGGGGGHGGARLLNWMRNAPGLRKLRLRRWNSTGSWVNISPEPCGGTIDLSNFHVTEGNYTKRKNVFKLTTAAGSYCPLEAAGYGAVHAEVHRTQSASGLASVVGGGGAVTGAIAAGAAGSGPGSVRCASTVGLPGLERELLLQADSHSDMQQWMESLRRVCRDGSTGQLHSPVGWWLARAKTCDKVTERSTSVRASVTFPFEACATPGRRMDLILTAPIVRQYFPGTTARDVAYAYVAVQRRMGELVLLTVWRTRDYLTGGRGGQQAEPQRVAAQTSVQVHGGGGGTNSGDDYSPVLPAKSHRKYALGTRSPSGQSPVTKSRKTPQTAGCSSPTGSTDAPIVPSVVTNQQYHQPLAHHQPHHLTLPPQQQQQQQYGTKDSSDRESGSPKSKTWKGIVARQFRKMQGQGPPGSPGVTGGGPGAADLLTLPDGASINVPLQHCPVSEENPFVPLVLTKCTGIVESKGLGVVGIYRIPGNTAAITQLTETINRGLDEAALRDPRWDDVNVVSSLLKSFIRNLPEPLLPNELYGGFIAADKLGGQRRLLELRQLLHRVPPMNYETLKHLMRHLHRVSTHSEANLMDPRNLAIVFGPSVVRSANESLETAVKDMRHQCQIVEVLINYYQYFFEDGLLPSVDESKHGAGAVVDSGLEVPSASLLLDNVAKIEPLKEQSKESSSGFVANIVQAANRKIRRTAQRKHTMSSTTPDTLSLDSTTSAESKEQSSRVIRRYPDPKGGATVGPLSVGSGTDHRALQQTVHVGAAGGDAAGGGGTAAIISGAASTVAGPIAIRGGTRGGVVGPGSVGSSGSCEPSADDSQLQLLHHHHYHHHHYYHSSSSRHHSSQSADDASSVLNRSSEDDSNDSAFNDNGKRWGGGSMSLKTVTIALDNKLRSLRDSSIDSDRDQALESDGDLSGGGYGGTGRHSLHQQWSHMGRASRPLTLGENIPYADESPERPLIQGRAKPHRTSVPTNNNNHHQEEIGVTTTAATPPKQQQQQQLKKALPPAHSQKSLDSGGTVNSGTTNDSCLTLVNEADATLVDGSVAAVVTVEDAVGSPKGARNVSLSSDETDTSTTSNPREKLTAATYRIDTEKLKKMNRILTQLERKANNLERKFNLNRSLSLNYKSPKTIDCCCLTHHGLPAASHPSQAPLAHCCQHQQQVQQQQVQQVQQQQQQQLISNSLNNNNSTACHNHNGAGGGTVVSLRSRFSLTKDEKTDKNINRRRQIHDTTVVPSPVASSSTCAGNGNASHGSNSDSGGEPCPGPQLILTAATVAAAPPSAASSQRQRRHVGSRSIRRRHTVGGTHDYYPSKINAPHHHHHHQYHHHHHQPHHHHHQQQQHHSQHAPAHPITGAGCCPVPQQN
uniref:Rho-GAP domain-containing protein n=1 Tax=Anopheles dirus TaxID=7168 RepID=A0A182MZI8_9DIPT